MTKRNIIFLISLLCLPTLSASQTRGFQRSKSGKTKEKLALIIGNNAYDGDNKLDYAIQDAKTMSVTLYDQNYAILEGYDLNYTNFDALIKEFAKLSQSYKECIFYYAGHAFEEGGINYLLPIKADPNQYNLGEVCIVVEDILAAIDNPNIPKLLILDACRSKFRSYNPREKRAAQIRKNTLIIYSTVSDTRVWDNNPFTEKFSEAIQSGGCVEEIFKEVSRNVLRKNSSQLIWQEGSLQGEICFEEKVARPDDMVFVKGGWFEMGCTSGQNSLCKNDEKPVHSVRIDDFYIGATEITVRQFESFIIATGHKTTAEQKGFRWVSMESNYDIDSDEVNWKYNREGKYRLKDEINHPVTNISWYDAVAYCNWRSEKDPNKQYRLPTEAEWEYAARGGSFNEETIYSGGNDLFRLGWFEDNSVAGTYEVKKKNPNKLGIYDMSGNVYEWCIDRYGPYHKNGESNSQENKSNPERVLRGGSWYSGPQDCRVSSRYKLSRDGFSDEIGFRIVATRK